MLKTKDNEVNDQTSQVVGILLGFDMVNQYRCAIKKYFANDVARTRTN